MAKIVRSGSHLDAPNLGLKRVGPPSQRADPDEGGKLAYKKTMTTARKKYGHFDSDGRCYHHESVRTNLAVPDTI